MFFYLLRFYPRSVYILAGRDNIPDINFVFAFQLTVVNGFLKRGEWTLGGKMEG
jgi:hypothetical protein